jgi:hypothetical protein
MEECGGAVSQGSVIKDLQFADDRLLGRRGKSAANSVDNSVSSW